MGGIEIEYPPDTLIREILYFVTPAGQKWQAGWTFDTSTVKISTLVPTRLLQD